MDVTKCNRNFFKHINFSFKNWYSIYKISYLIKQVCRATTYHNLVKRYLIMWALDVISYLEKKLHAWIIHHRNGIPSLFFWTNFPFTLQAVVLSLGLAKDVQNDDVLVEKWKEKQRRFAKVSVQSLLQARRHRQEAEGWSTKLTVANYIIKSFLSKVS